MELLRSWGLEEQVRAAEIDVEWQAPGRRRRSPPRPPGTAVEVGFPSRAQSAVVSPARPACVPQDHLEPVLEEHLRSLPAARLRRGVEVIGVDSRDDDVDVEVRDCRRRRRDPRPLPDRRRRHAQHGPDRARHPDARPGPPRRPPRPSASGRRCGTSSASTATSSTSSRRRGPTSASRSGAATAGCTRGLGSRARAARRPDAGRAQARAPARLRRPGSRAADRGRRDRRLRRRARRPLPRAAARS